MSPLFLWVVVIIQDIASLDYSLAYDMELIECPIPDYPQWGGYGPRQDYYVPGDVIHYFCDTDTYIGGNYYRRCEDTGNWSGDTPVCDQPATFTSVTQSSTDQSSASNDAESATDDLRGTCIKTEREAGGATWTGVLATPGEALRVMLFLPKVHVDYEVLAIKANGDEYSCGSKSGRIDRQEWHFHNCPGPNNHGVVAIKIKSRSEEPLELCELVTHVLTEPTCVDPHYPVDNGRFQLTRKRASLLCDAHFSRSPDGRLDCVRNGVWNRKSLYCIEKQWESNSGSQGEREPEREREPLAGAQ